MALRILAAAHALLKQSRLRRFGGARFGPGFTGLVDGDHLVWKAAVLKSHELVKIAVQPTIIFVGVKHHRHPVMDGSDRLILDLLRMGRDHADAGRSKAVVPPGEGSV